MSLSNNELAWLFDPGSNTLDLALEHNENLYAQLAQKTAEYLDVPVAMTATAILGALSCAAQGAYVVKRPGGHTHPVSLYLLTLAEPNMRKTTVDDLFFEIPRAFEREQLEKHKQASTQIKQAYQIWKIKAKEQEKVFQKALRDQVSTEALDDAEAILQQILSEEPQSHVQPSFLYDSITPEALVERLGRYLPIATLSSSEASSVLNSRQLQSLHLYNNLWSGSDVKHDRLSTGQMNITEGRLTLTLMTQPVVAKEFMKKKGELALGTGFLSRLLVSVPPNNIGERNLRITSEKPKELETFNQRIRSLLEESLEAILSSERRPKELIFSHNAQNEWRELAQTIEEMQRPNGLYQFATGHAGKLMENISRVSAVMHLLENPNSIEIQEETLTLARQLVLQLSKDYLGYFTPKPELIKQTESLILYLFKHKDVDSNFTIKLYDRNDILKMGPGSLRNAEALDRVFDFLSQTGYLESTYDGYVLHLIPQQNSPLKNGLGFMIDPLPPHTLVKESQIGAYDQYPINSGINRGYLLSSNPSKAKEDKQALEAYHQEKLEPSMNRIQYVKKLEDDLKKRFYSNMQEWLGRFGVTAPSPNVSGTHF